MSLLEDAREVQTNRGWGSQGRCAFAEAVESAFAGEVDEVIELMKAPDVRQGIKIEVIASRLEIMMSPSTIRHKMVGGCRCSWCREHGLTKS